MVYKVYGKTGKSYLFQEWAKDNLKCIIDNSSLCISNAYIFDFREHTYSELKEFFDTRNLEYKLIYLYSNLSYEELEHFINFLETLKHNFIIFIKEENV